VDQIVLSIDGMTCGHCVAAVRKELAAVGGVTVDDVAIGTASLTFDPGITSVERIAEAVDRAGYTVTASR
jgi:copper chaperone